MNIDEQLKRYNLKEVFNHDAYVEYMDSKVVRNPRTGTLLDFITEEQQRDLNAQGIEDLSAFDPTPVDIQEHMNFAMNIFLDLYKTSPDEFLKFLGNTEEGSIVLCSTNWYERYNYKYSKEVNSF